MPVKSVCSVITPVPYTSALRLHSGMCYRLANLWVFLNVNVASAQEEESEGNPPYSPDKIRELQREIADLRQALQHERELHSSRSLCNDQVLGSDISSICANATSALQQVEPSAFDQQSNNLEDNIIKEATGKHEHIKVQL